MTLTAGDRIGFVSTRFAGTDGVSLETDKWARVLERIGHPRVFFAGQLDERFQPGRAVPEAFYRHAEIAAINREIFAPGDSVDGDADDQGLGIRRRDLFSPYVRSPRLSRRIEQADKRFGPVHVVSPHTLTKKARSPTSTRLSTLPRPTLVAPG